MSKDKIIILYRHAETNMNVEDITMGQLDIDTNFTENGERQILEIGDNLLENNIQIIYSSDYKRAYETACKAVLYKKLNIPIVKNLAFRGLNMGDYQNIHYNDFIKNENVIKCFKDYNIQFPNGESINQLNNRIFNEIINICETTKYDRIAIFSHSAAISNLKAYLTNEKYESIRMCCLLYRNNQLNVLGTVSSKTNDVLLHIGEINEV